MRQETHVYTYADALIDAPELPSLQLRAEDLGRHYAEQVGAFMRKAEHGDSYWTQFNTLSSNDVAAHTEFLGQLALQAVAEDAADGAVEDLSYGFERVDSARLSRQIFHTPAAGRLIIYRAWTLK